MKGKVKRKAYLDYLVKIRAEEEQARRYGLRITSKSIDEIRDEFERKFEINPLFYFRFEISKLVEEDLIEVDLDNIKLTRKGLDLANLVFGQFV